MKLEGNNKPFTFYWGGGKREILIGETVSDAANRAGYGNGALAALDFFAEGAEEDYEWLDGDWRKLEHHVMEVTAAEVGAIGVFFRLKLNRGLSIQFPTKDRLVIESSYGHYDVGWVKHLVVYVANYCEGPFSPDSDEDHHYMVGGSAYFHPEDTDKAVAHFMAIQKAWFDRHNDPHAPHLRKAYEDCFGSYDIGNVSIAEIEARQPTLS